MSNGSHLHWEYYKRFDDLSEEDVRDMSIDDFTEFEEQRTLKNVMYVCHDLAYRIQDAAGPKGSMDLMSGYSCQTKESHFFNDTEYLAEYLKAASVSKRAQMPGHAYYSKILTFFNQHFEKGELYMEYRKSDCANNGDEPCQFCQNCPWVGPKLSRTPCPYPAPDGENYLPYTSTPIDGREADDFQPRAQLKKQFDASSIRSDKPDTVQNFSKTFCVDEALVFQELSHMELMKFKADKRRTKQQNQKQQNRARKYEDYEWTKLYSEKKIASLTVSDLDVYLTYKKLMPEEKLYKNQKVAIIEAELAKIVAGQICHHLAQDHNADSSSESDTSTIESDDEEEILDSSGSNESSEEEEEINEANVQTQTHAYSRTGRKQGNWQSRKWFGD